MATCFSPVKRAMTRKVHSSGQVVRTELEDKDRQLELKAWMKCCDVQNVLDVKWL